MQLGSVCHYSALIWQITALCVLFWIHSGLSRSLSSSVLASVGGLSASPTAAHAENEGRLFLALKKLTYFCLALTNTTRPNLSVYLSLSLYLCLSLSLSLLITSDMWRSLVSLSLSLSLSPYLSLSPSPSP